MPNPKKIPNSYWRRVRFVQRSFSEVGSLGDEDRIEIEGFIFNFFWRLDIGVCDLRTSTRPIPGHRLSVY
jgi:hypothetical protein